MHSVLTVEIDINSTGVVVAEILSQLQMMAWKDLVEVRDLCREKTKPLREAAAARYKVGKDVI
jgi:hypothetical protein